MCQTILLFQQKHVYYYYYSGEHSGYIQGTLSAYSGKIQCTFREYSAYAFIRKRSMHIQGTSSAHSLHTREYSEHIIQGTFSAHSVSTNRTLKCVKLFCCISRSMFILINSTIQANIQCTFREHSMHIPYELRWKPVSPHPNYNKHSKKVPKF
jgi:hypothetical protein